MPCRPSSDTAHQPRRLCWPAQTGSGAAARGIAGGLGEGNLGITGTLEETRKLTSGLGIYFQKQETGDEFYSVDHSAAVLVIDPDGGFSAVFGGTHKAENFVHDLPLLMVQP